MQKFPEGNFDWFLVIILCVVIIGFGYYSVPNTVEFLSDASAIESSEGKTKFRFWGTHDMTIYGEPKIDFRVNPRTTDPFTIVADVHVGNYKTQLYGGGMMKQFYLYGDNQCKRIEGFEYLMSLEGDEIRLDFKGKICFIGSQMRMINLIFDGSRASGIFEGAEDISGTLTGSSDQYESNYNLNFNSILVFEN